MLALWVVVVLVALVWGVDNAETDLRQRALDRLAADGHDVAIDISGRDARLIGTVTQEEIATAIVDSVDSIPGIRRVNDEIVVDEPEAAPLRMPDVTMRLIHAIVAGCNAEPALNAWYLGLDEGRRLHDKVHLSIAMDTVDGLFVPVLRDVGNRDEADLRSGLEAMKADVRARTVPLEELRGGTITLSNFGMFGGQHAALAVLPPQVAILGAGRVHDRVVPLDGAPAIRRALPSALTFDHRAVMGGEASRFLAAVVADLGKAD